MNAWGPDGPTARQWIALGGFAVVFVFYRPGGEPDLLDTVLLPTIALLSAWLFTRSVMAVALGVGLLGAAHSDPGASDLLSSRVYPGLAILGGLAVAAVLVGRARRTLRARQGRDPDDPPGTG